MTEYLVRYIDCENAEVHEVVVKGRERRDILVSSLLSRPEDTFDSIRCWTLNRDGSIRANSAVKEWRC